MQELLFNTDDPNAPLSELRLCELSILDSDDIWKGRHMIREIHARYHEQSGDLVWHHEEFEYAKTDEEAKRRYEVRRAALVEGGLKYSDMEM